LKTDGGHKKAQLLSVKQLPDFFLHLG